MDAGVESLSVQFGSLVQGLLNKKRQEYEHKQIKRMPSRTNHVDPFYGPDADAEAEQALKKIEGLECEVESLKARCSTFDELKADNARLREALESSATSAVEHQSLVPSKRPPKSPTSTNASSDAFHSTNDDQLIVDSKIFRELEKNCEKYAKELQKSNSSGQEYRKRCYKYQERNRRNEAILSSWQNYHDSLMQRSAEAHLDINGFLRAVAACPNSETLRSQPSLSLATSARPSPTAGLEPQSHLNIAPLGTARVSGDATSFTTISQAMRPPLTLLAVESFDPDPMPAPDLPRPFFARNPDTNSPNAVRGKSEAEKTFGTEPVPTSSSGRIIRSSQSTAGGDDISDASPSKEHAVPEISDDDEPVVVSHRSLKRKAHTRHGWTGTDGKVVSVKTDSSSSPLRSAPFANFGQNESIDLDEVPHNYTTPRKRKFHKILKTTSFMDFLTPSAPLLRHERSTSEPTTGADMHQLSQETLARATVESEVLKNLTDSQHIQADPAGVDREEPTNAVMNVVQLKSKPGRLIQSRHAEALQPLSTNTPLISRTSDGRSYKKRRRNDEGNVAQVAEDGESYSRIVNRKSDLLSKDTPDRPIKSPVLQERRIIELLEKSSPPSKPVLGLTNGGATKVSEWRSGVIETSSISPQKLMAPSSSLVETYSAPKIDTNSPVNRTHSTLGLEQPKKGEVGASATVLSSTLSPARKRPEDLGSIDSTSRMQLQPTPQSSGIKGDFGWLSRTASGKVRIPTLSRVAPDPRPRRRLRRFVPVERLSLKDFKINPAGNFGLDYAYVDVTRGRECRFLPGCTRRECCGDQFLKMAELGGVKPKPRSLWDISSSQDGESADDRLLREYMGENDEVIASMSKEAKEEALTRAKAAVLADKFGRHRQQWQRSRTPPGYWRTEFPNTQEALMDQQESKRREREEVEMRWREAMRSGGRWMFIDE